MILPDQYQSDTTLQYAPLMSKGLTGIYLILLGGILAGLVALPYIYVDISIHSPGIVRPSQERTAVKSLISGQIDHIFYPEGAVIKKDAILISLSDNGSIPKKLQNSFELNQQRQFINDLTLLTGTRQQPAAAVKHLKSPLYRQQAYRFINQLAEQEAILKKLDQELETARFLAQDKVIAPKELFDKTADHERQQAVYVLLKSEQFTKWQEELSKSRLEYAQLQARQQQLHADNRLYTITAPVTGTIQGLSATYTGSTVQAGESICIISPETDLIAECYVTTRDAGFVHPGQAATFRIDAFNYQYFGQLTGKVSHIDNDFTLINNEPAFKVFCTFNKTQLHLKNGYSGQLKKGMTLQGDFRIGSRTVWQLLFDTIDDWIDPTVQQMPNKKTMQ